MELLTEFRIYTKNRFKNLLSNIGADGRYRLGFAIVVLIMMLLIIFKLASGNEVVAVVDDPTIPRNMVRYEYTPDTNQVVDNSLEVPDSDTVIHDSVGELPVIERFSTYKIHESKLVPEHAERGIKIMLDNNVHPSLLLAIIDARSKGDIFMTSPDSSARGYGQINENTSRWIYEDIMGKKNYTHSMHNDPYIDIEIMTNYITHLMKVYNGNVRSVVTAYNDGVDDIDFFSDIEIFLFASNTSPDEIEKIYNGGNLNDFIRR